MSNQHPITPSPELVNKWYDEWLNADDLTHLDTRVAILAARWGADQELEACSTWLRANGFPGTAFHLNDLRRSKPRSLKEQALDALDHICVNHSKATDHEYTIRRALEALPND